MVAKSLRLGQRFTVNCNTDVEHNSIVAFGRRVEGGLRTSVGGVILSNFSLQLEELHSFNPQNSNSVCSSNKTKYDKLYEAPLGPWQSSLSILLPLRHKLHKKTIKQDSEEASIPGVLQEAPPTGKTTIIWCTSHLEITDGKNKAEYLPIPNLIYRKNYIK